jgi:hypothetical protein
MFVDHLVPNAKSRVNYKGALAGQDAHTVWIGDVFIRAAAEGTDTYELNRNLLLSDGARADSVPNLEIETGEIIERDMTAAELKIYEANKEKEEIKKAEADAKAIARQALLTKLGITQEEAQLLLGGN